MSGKDGEATFRINIDGNAADASKDVASSARLAAKSIAEYENEIKALSGDLRRLRGNSDDVNAAKATLKKRIDEAKTSASALTLELTKQGTSYAAAAAAAKKYGDGAAKTLPNLRKALSPITEKASKALGPMAAKASKALEPLSKRLGAAKAAFASVGKAAKEDLASVLPSVGSMFGAVASGGALAVAAVAAVGAALVAGVAALGAYSLANADAAAKMQRSRQALLGNAKDASALGEQIDALAGKVPQGVEELNELAKSLSKTRLSGKAIVDTMGAVAQATGAVDAAAGSKIQEIITRGQMTGRLFLNQLELQGTGLDFDDVAKAYAEGTKKSLDAARKELFEGAVPLEQGAEAIKKATEAKFGDLNLKNAFSLENGPKKLKEQFDILSKGVDLSPLSKGLQDVFGQLQPNAPLGAALKTFMETFGNGIVDIASKSIPLLLEGFKWIIVGALRLGTVFYETKKQIRDAFEAGDWVGLGKSIIVGMAKGVYEALKIHDDAFFSLGKTIKQAFTDELKIHSPSRVFEGYGRNTVEGYAQGVERGSARASGAVQAMVQAPALPAAPTASSQPIEVHIHGAPTGNAQALQSPEFLARLTQAVRDGMTKRGLAATTLRAVPT